MEPECSLPCPQQLATCSHPEPDQSSSHVTVDDCTVRRGRQEAHVAVTLSGRTVMPGTAETLFPVPAGEQRCNYGAVVTT